MRLTAFAPAFAACLALGGAGCQSQDTGAPAAGPVEVAAEIDGQTITVAEVDERIKQELFESRTGSPARLYDLRVDTLDQMIQERLLEAEAKRRGVPTEAVVDLELKEMGTVSEEEITAFYKQNFEAAGEMKLEEIRPQIQRYLESRRAAEVPKRLRERAKVAVLLEAPRFDVKPDGPSKGPADARITIVEFSDFQCPYCQRAMGTLEQVLAKYPADVRVVYRHLPLDRIHPNARPAAEASACADEQGRFWEYHDKLFQNNRALAREDLVRYAGEVGLDAARFQACVDERRFKDKVEADLQAAREVGITGTPAFVVNGTLLSGAQPPEEFYEVIDAVLGKAPEGGAAAPADAGGAS
jgi:protein-disulfide isomerase